MISSPSRRLAIALSLGCTFAAATASAQDVVAPDGSLVHRSTIERACGESLVRFCPASLDPPGQTRNQVICLKPYRSSLPRSCRTAVGAASK